MKNCTCAIVRMIVCVSIFVLSPKNITYATHAMGADLTYQCLGNNQYEFTLSFYRDCGGVAVEDDFELNLNSTSCNISYAVGFALESSMEVSQLCPSQLPNSTCQGGTLQGVEQYVFTATTTLPDNCNDWIASYRNCCRNASITNSVDPQDYDLYIEALVNNLDAPCNNSPTFSTLPVPYVCVGQLFNYNHGAVDAEGDSLAFALVAPHDNATDLVPYQSGFNTSYPISTSPANNFNFSTTTGQISFVPDVAQIGIVAVRVSEYRNGVLIGSTIRDLQLVAINCPNNIPVANPPSNITGGGYSNGVFEACQGDVLGFRIDVSDADASDLLEITENIATDLPGATVTTTNGNPASLVVNWTVPTANVGAYTFTLSVHDDACPIQAYQAFGYVVQVTSVDITASDTIFCPNTSKNILLETYTNGIKGTYSWSPTTGLDDPTSATPRALVSQSTDYTVVFTGADGCVATETVSINAYDMDLKITPSKTEHCTGDAPVELGGEVSVDGKLVGQNGCQEFNQTKSVAAPNALNTFTFAGLSASPVGEGVLVVRAMGDLNSGSEYWTILDENGNHLDVVGMAMQECGDTIIVAIPLTNLQLNMWAADENISFQASKSNTVNTTLCGDDFISMQLTFCAGKGTDVFYEEQMAGTSCSGQVIGYNHNVQFTGTLPDANDDVVLQFCFSGDYSSASAEFIAVMGENGVDLGSFGEITAVGRYTDCSSTPLCQTVIIKKALWNSWNDDGVVSFVLIPNEDVDNANCSDYSCVSDAAVRYTATNPVSYSWSPANHLSAADILNPLARPPVSTTYTLTASNPVCVVERSVDITCSLLPVECTNFTAAAADHQKVYLKWVLESEFMNEGFWVERSTDGVEFESIAWIASKGDSPVGNTYTWVDELHENASKHYYYRLRQLDWDGRASFVCNVVAVEMPVYLHQPMKIYPNPVADRIHIEMDAPSDGVLEIKVYDALGRIAIEKYTVAIDVGLNMHSLDLSQLEEGVYWLHTGNPVWGYQRAHAITKIDK